MSSIEWTNETKRCSRCGDAKPRSAFATDRSRQDGLTYWCSDCRNRRSRERHVSRATGVRSGPPRVLARDGDVRQARRSINYEVERGLRPHPNELPCADCSHRWAPGERRHEYDHHLGYAAEHHLEVEPVCTTCHRAREQDRAGRAA